MTAPSCEITRAPGPATTTAPGPAMMGPDWGGMAALYFCPATSGRSYTRGGFGSTAAVLPGCTAAPGMPSSAASLDVGLTAPSGTSGPRAGLYCAMVAVTVTPGGSCWPSRWASLPGLGGARGEGRPSNAPLLATSASLSAPGAYGAADGPATPGGSCACSCCCCAPATPGGAPDGSGVVAGAGAPAPSAPPAPPRLSRLARRAASSARSAARASASSCSLVLRLHAGGQRTARSGVSQRHA